MVDTITIVLIILALLCALVAIIQLYFRVIKLELALEILMDIWKKEK
jgi:hypothetical protein